MGDLESDQKKIHYINLGLRLALFGLGFVSLVQTKNMSNNKSFNIKPLFFPDQILCTSLEKSGSVTTSETKANGRAP